MKTLILLIGLSGSGKNDRATMVLRASDPYGGYVITVESFGYKNRTWQFMPSKLRKARKNALSKTVHYMVHNVSTIIINDRNLTKKDRKPYETLAATWGYQVKYELVGNKDPESVEQYFKTSRNKVPLEVIQRQAARLELP